MGSAKWDPEDKKAETPADIAEQTELSNEIIEEVIAEEKAEKEGV